MPCTNIEQDVKTVHDLAIGELLSKADNVCKGVISAYKCEAKHGTNVNTLSSKFNRPILETCALFLGITLNDEAEKPLFANKKLIADRIILKIESHFSTLCRECNSSYHHRFKAVPAPLLTCHSCFQGSHDCDNMKGKAEAFIELKAMFGLVWLCHDCLPLNDVAMTYSVSTTVEAEDTTVEAEDKPQSETLDAEEDADDGEGDNTKKDSVPRIPPNQRSDICTRYKHGNCPHGLAGNRMVKGANCGKPHPHFCFRYRKHGTDKEKGCSNGKECKYFHPIICKTSLKGEKCTKDVCSHIHLSRFPKVKKVKGGSGRSLASSRPAQKGAPPGTPARSSVNKGTKLTVMNQADFIQALLSQQEQFTREMKDLMELVTQTRYKPPSSHPTEWPGMIIPPSQPPLSMSQPQFQPPYMAALQAQMMPGMKTCPQSIC